jgi:hypothetical protein
MDEIKMYAVDHMVRNATAFVDWADMESSLRTGYVPTLFGATRHERLLRKVVRAKGYTVYPAVVTTERLGIIEG